MRVSKLQFILYFPLYCVLHFKWTGMIGFLIILSCYTGIAYLISPWLTLLFSYQWFIVMITLFEAMIDVIKNWKYDYENKFYYL